MSHEKHITAWCTFQPPQPILPWSGERDATKSGPQCIQFTASDTGASIGASEDCLTVDIYTPLVGDDRPPVSVFVYIHGGGFLFGSTHEFSPESILKSMVSRGVIVVMVQYRLGPLGVCSARLLTRVLCRLCHCTSITRARGRQCRRRGLCTRITVGAQKHTCIWRRS